MNITPETARSFADDATLKVEIPTRIEKDQVFYSLVTDDDRTVATDLDKGDAELLAIAPDLAQTVIDQAAKIERLQKALHKADKWGNCLEMLIEGGFIEPEDMETP